jgi:hypothetical protein
MAFGSNTPSFSVPRASTPPVPPSLPKTQVPTPSGAALPGTSAAPRRSIVNVESGPPDFSYLCDAQYCIPAPSIPPQPTVNVNGTSTVFSPFPLLTHYFNLDPVIFGADWGIFTGNVSVPSTSSSATPSSNATISEFSFPRL